MKKTRKQDNVISVLSGFTGDITRGRGFKPNLWRGFKPNLSTRMPLFWKKS